MMKLVCVAIKKIKNISEKDEVSEYSIYKFKTHESEEVYAEMSFKSVNGMFEKGDEVEFKRISKQTKIK